MADLKIEREFATTPERLFKALSQEAEVLQWWGHDGMTIPECKLDFSRKGPWHCVLITGDGTRVKMSGHVTHVRDGSSVGFTWGWHDGDDARGEETHVTFTVTPCETGARLTIDHRDFAEDAEAERHLGGWSAGPLPRLERYVGTFET